MSDLALRRHGCPIFAPMDSLLIKHPKKDRAVQNVGGIADVSMLPASDVEGCYELDTGPGGEFIDSTARYFQSALSTMTKMVQTGREERSTKRSWTTFYSSYSSCRRSLRPQEERPSVIALVKKYATGYLARVRIQRFTSPQSRA